jgi:hypothetical protein
MAAQRTGGDASWFHWHAISCIIFVKQILASDGQIFGRRIPVTRQLDQRTRFSSGFLLKSEHSHTLE